MKIRPMSSQFFHVEWRIDGHDEANSLFSQFFENA